MPSIFLSLDVQFTCGIASRRGTEAFHPKKRDRTRLHRVLGVPPDKFLLMFAGRVDGGKSVMTLARAARILLERGAPIHVLTAGKGNQRQEIRRWLGADVTAPGYIAQEELS